MDSPLRTGVQLDLVTLSFSPATGAFEDAPLRACLAGRELLYVAQHFFVHQGIPHLLLVLSWHAASPTPEPTREHAEPTSPRAKGRDATPRELPDADRPTYETLRAWRSARAQRDGVPPYIVFTNRELVALVRARPSSKSALLQIPGIGEGKVARYGDAVLAELAAHGTDGDVATSADEAPS